MTRMRTQMPEKLLIPFFPSKVLLLHVSFTMFSHYENISMTQKGGYDILHSEINIFVQTSFTAYLKDEEISIPKFNVMRNDYPFQQTKLQPVKSILNHQTIQMLNFNGNQITKF